MEVLLSASNLGGMGGGSGCSLGVGNKASYSGSADTPS